MQSIENKTDNRNERIKFEEYINYLYLNQYKNYFQKFSKIFETIKQLNINENEKTIILNCFDLLNLIYEKRKYLDLEEFENYKEFNNFLNTLENEKDNDKLYSTKMAQHILKLTEIILEFIENSLVKFSKSKNYNN